MLTKFSLSDAQKRDLRLRGTDAEAYVAVVDFRGPRGRRYRPVVRGTYRSVEQAIQEIAHVRSRPYASGAFPTGDKVYAVNWKGEVLREVER